MRKRRAVKRDVLPDSLYKSKVVTKLINQIMIDGKKGTAQRIVYDAFNIIKEKTGEDAMVVFERAMENIKPNLEVKSRRVGGANYQVPIEVKAAKNTQSKSLKVYNELYNPKYMIRISTKDFGYNPETKIKSIPLYAVFLINNLTKEN